MTINQLLTQDIQTSTSIIVAAVILFSCYIIYSNDERKQKDIEAWEEYRTKRALEIRGLKEEDKKDS